MFKLISNRRVFNGINFRNYFIISWNMRTTQVGQHGLYTLSFVSTRLWVRIEMNGARCGTAPGPSCDLTGRGPAQVLNDGAVAGRHEIWRFSHPLWEVFLFWRNNQICLSKVIAPSFFFIKWCVVITSQDIVCIPCV